MDCVLPGAQPRATKSLGSTPAANPSLAVVKLAIIAAAAATTAAVFIIFIVGERISQPLARRDRRKAKCPCHAVVAVAILPIRGRRCSGRITLVHREARCWLEARTRWWDIKWRRRRRRRRD